MSKPDPLMLNVIDPRQPSRMSTEDFLALWGNKWLRQFLVDSAKNIARGRIELAEDLLQEAWLRIDLRPPGLKIEYYADEGFRAMRAYYQREIRRWRLTGKARFWSEEPGIRQARKGAVRFFKKRACGRL